MEQRMKWEHKYTIMERSLEHGHIVLLPSRIHTLGKHIYIRLFYSENRDDRCCAHYLCLLQTKPATMVGRAPVQRASATFWVGIGSCTTVQKCAKNPAPSLDLSLGRSCSTSWLSRKELFGYFSRNKLERDLLYHRNDKNGWINSLLITGYLLTWLTNFKFLSLWYPDTRSMCNWHAVAVKES